MRHLPVPSIAISPRWRLRCLGMLLVAFVLVDRPGAAGQEAGEEGRAMLARAVQLSDLRSGGPGSLILRESVRLLGMDGWPDGIAEGSYELLVLDSEHWREELAFQGWSETNGRFGPTRWRLRTRANKPMRMFQAFRTVDPGAHLRLAQHATIAKVTHSNPQGRSIVCLGLKGPEKDTSELCFDRISAALVSARYHNPEAFYTFSGQHTLEDKIIPRLLRCIEAAEPAVEAEVTSLAVVEGLDIALFAPVKGAILWPHCDEPTPPRVLAKREATQPVHAKAQRQFGTVMCIGEVSPDGIIEDIAVVQSRGGLLDQAVKKALATWQWEPARCGGTPVPYEVKVQYTFMP